MAWVLLVRKNSNPELQNQFLFCNMFLLFRRYLHFGHEDIFFRQEDMKNMFFLVMFSCQRKIIIFVSKL